LSDFQRLFSVRGVMNVELLSARKATLLELYRRLTENTAEEPVPLETYRGDVYERYVLGDVVEKL
jgi:hypothetical protein